LSEEFWIKKLALKKAMNKEKLKAIQEFIEVKSRPKRIRTIKNIISRRGVCKDTSCFDCVFAGTGFRCSIILPKNICYTELSLEEKNRLDQITKKEGEEIVFHWAITEFLEKYGIEEDVVELLL